MDFHYLGNLQGIFIISFVVPEANRGLLMMMMMMMMVMMVVMMMMMKLNDMTWNELTWHDMKRNRSFYDDFYYDH